MRVWALNFLSIFKGGCAELGTNTKTSLEQRTALGPRRGSHPTEACSCRRSALQTNIPNTEGCSRAGPCQGKGRLQSQTSVCRDSCPPAHVVVCHDVERLGGLYPHHVISILQQSFQAFQAACKALKKQNRTKQKPLNVCQSQKSTNLEANR